MAERKGTASKRAIERHEEPKKKVMDTLGVRLVRSLEQLMDL
jgi:hypothetical protein